MDFLQNNLIYLIPVFGIVGIVIMAIKSAWVIKQDAGDENMQRLSGYIADGAMAFLKAEWKVLGYFAAIAAVSLRFHCLAFEIQQAVFHLEAIIGRITPDEILDSIFSQFCIGK